MNNLEKQIKEIQKDILFYKNRGYYDIFTSFREDFVEGRTSWEDLAEMAENLYRIADSILDIDIDRDTHENNQDTK